MRPGGANEAAVRGSLRHFGGASSPSPACGGGSGLWGGHIFEPESASDLMEALQASMHGYGTWRFGVSGAVPSAETSDDPCGPRQRSCDEGVPEAVGFAVD